MVYVGARSWAGSGVKAHTGSTASSAGPPSGKTWTRKSPAPQQMDRSAPSPSPAQRNNEG